MALTSIAIGSRLMTSLSAARSSSSGAACPIVRWGTMSSNRPSYGWQSGKARHTAVVRARNEGAGSGASHSTSSSNQPVVRHSARNCGTLAAACANACSTVSSIAAGGTNGYSTVTWQALPTQPPDPTALDTDRLQLPRQEPSQGQHSLSARTWRKPTNPQTAKTTSYVPGRRDRTANVCPQKRPLLPQGVNLDEGMQPLAGEGSHSGDLVGGGPCVERTLPSPSSAFGASALSIPARRHADLVGDNQSEKGQLMPFPSDLLDRGCAAGERLL